MRNLFLDLKIKKELKEFKVFKQNYKFIPLEVTETDDGSVFVANTCIREGKDGDWVGETEDFVNVGYKIHGAISKVLSNLFPYEFYFRGFKLNSIEPIFQAFKFKDAKMQKLLFKYYGLNSNNIKSASNYDWKKTGIVYFLGKKFNRFEKEYAEFIDEVYISAIQNSLYRNVIKSIGNKYILHAMGGPKAENTSWTRLEFEKELNCLKDFLIMKDNKK